MRSVIEITLIFVLIITFWLYAIFSKRIRLFLKNNIYIKLLLILLTVGVTSIIGLYLAEHGVNPEFSSLERTFWIVIFYVLGGLRSTFPKTEIGRIVFLILLITGIGTVGIAIGKIIELILDKEVKLKKLKDHIIICNWNSEGESVIRELHNPLSRPEIPVLVISKERPKNEESLRKMYPSEFSNVEFRLGDVTQPDVLRYANVANSYGVLVLADDKTEDPDAAVILTLLSISYACKDYNKKPYIIVEAKDENKIKHLKEAGADEVICKNKFAIGLLSQSLLYHNISSIYSDLLSYSETTCEFYYLCNDDIVEACGERFKMQDKTFQDLLLLFGENRNSINPVLLIGIRKNTGEVIINPKPPQKIEEGDSLIVMSYKKPTKDEIRYILCTNQKR